MKTSLKDEAAPLLLVAAMFVVAAAVWSRAPALMPVHWDWAGNADRLGGRFEGLLTLPLAALGLYFLLLVLPHIDPRRAHYAAFAGPYRAIRTLIVLLLLGLQVFRLTRLDHPGAPSAVLPAMLGVLLVAVGNYLPKVQSNWFVGVRTPWTLSSEESWRRTHRLAGWLFVIGGLAATTVGLVRPSAGVPAVVTALAVAAVTSVVYSYVVWRQAADRTTATDLE